MCIGLKTQEGTGLFSAPPTLLGPLDGHPQGAAEKTQCISLALWPSHLLSRSFPTSLLWMGREEVLHKWGWGCVLLGSVFSTRRCQLSHKPPLLGTTVVQRGLLAQAVLKAQHAPALPEGQLRLREPSPAVMQLELESRRGRAPLVSPLQL